MNIYFPKAWNNHQNNVPTIQSANSTCTHLNCTPAREMKRMALAHTQPRTALYHPLYYYWLQLDEQRTMGMAKWAMEVNGSDYTQVTTQDRWVWEVTVYSKLPCWGERGLGTTRLGGWVGGKGEWLERGAVRGLTPGTHKCHGACWCQGDRRESVSWGLGCWGG